MISVIDVSRPQVSRLDTAKHGRHGSYKSLPTPEIATARNADIKDFHWHTSSPSHAVSHRVDSTALSSENAKMASQSAKPRCRPFRRTAMCFTMDSTAHQRVEQETAPPRLLTKDKRERNIK
jgi:hypothetical protein